MSEETAGQGAFRDEPRRRFAGSMGGRKTRFTGADYLLSWPQMSILVGYLAQLAYVQPVQQSGGIGKYRQIVGALRPYGEQVKTPGRTSQMSCLR